jgi:hypothetical protein
MFVEQIQNADMEKLNLQNELSVFGIQVKTFPDGIGEAFDALVKKIGGFDRPYYGISYMNNGEMVYLATALEKNSGEAGKYKCNRYTIESGEYLSETVHDWRNKTVSIKHVFEEIIKDKRVDRTKPAIEWYKDDNEMVCMVKTGGQ